MSSKIISIRTFGWWVYSVINSIRDTSFNFWVGLDMCVAHISKACEFGMCDKYASCKDVNSKIRRVCDTPSPIVEINKRDIVLISKALWVQK